MGRTGRWLAITIGASIACAGFVACGATVDPPIEVVGTAKTPPGSGADAGIDAGPVSCFQEDAGCNNLALCGGHVLSINVAGAAPAPSGGSIAPGLYLMTSYQVYTGPSGAAGETKYWFATTLQLSAPPSGDAGDGGDGSVGDAGDGGDGSVGDAEDGVDAATGDAGPVLVSYPLAEAYQNYQQGFTSLSGDLETQGTAATFEYACGGGLTIDATYSTTATTLTVYYPDPGGTAGVIYSLMH